MALKIEDESRKRALLLHYAGAEVYDIFDTLPDTGNADEYDVAVNKLHAYFCPKVNTEYDVYVFRQARQNESESLDAYHTRLRQLASTCEFADVDKEIKSQIILSCSSARLRRAALKDSDMTLQKLLDAGRAQELSDKHAAGMETTGAQKEFPVRAVQKKNFKSQSSKTKNDKYENKTCHNCGGKFPHEGGQSNCPAKGKTCKECGKLNHFQRCCRSRNKNTNAESAEKQSQQQRPYRPKKAVRNVQTQNDQKSRKTATPDSSDDDYVFSVYTMQDQEVQKYSPIQILGTTVDVIVDSGASVNIVDDVSYEKLKHKCELRPSNAKVYPYGSTTPLPLRGKFIAAVHSKMKTVDKATFYVTQGNHGSLLSRKTATALGLLKVINSTSTENQTTDAPSTSQLISEYQDRFKGIGKLKDFQVKLHIDGSVQPSVQPHRRIPFHMRKKVEQELDKLEKQGIIERVSGPTPWVSPIVAAPKPKSPDQVRICVDMRLPNDAIQRERHITPTVDDLIHDLNGAVVFSKLDLNAGYHQLELHPESRYVTTFTTHTGLWRYTRLNFGINAAAEVFQNTIQQVLHDIPNVRNMSDDIIVYGKSQAEHNDSLKAVFQRLREKNLTLNAEKCEYSKPELEFFGYVFSAKGISADPKKITAIEELPPPQNVSEVRSLLGMTTYCSRFIHDYATISQPLRELTRKDTTWSWGPQQQSAMEKLKSRLIKHTTMAYFDPAKHSTILVDASPVGLGAILSQRDPSNGADDRIIAYASRALTSVEQRYSQTEREALAIVWACEHFHLYLYGSHFTVITDHKPLELIFNSPRATPPARLERWRLRLQPYSFKVKYKAGADNPADYMSRHPTEWSIPHRSSLMAEEYVNFVIDNAVPKAMTLKEVQEETKKDEVLCKVMHFLHTGNWLYAPSDATEAGHQMKALYRLRNQLTVNTDENIILRGTRIVLPTSLHHKAVSLAHAGHLGIVKTKQLLREKVWFPGIDDMVEKAIQHCIPCQAATPQNHMEPLKMSEIPKGPWQDVSIDFTGPFPSGEYLLVVVDEYSRFPEVEIVTSTAATTVIPKLDKIFSCLGIPAVAKTDNGPPFNGQAFKDFSLYLGFKHRKITPYWPRANAEAERFMKTLKKTITATHSEGRPWKQGLYTFLRNYRATPHGTTQQTPAELMFGRKLHTTLPAIPDSTPDTQLQATDHRAKERMKENADRRNRARLTVFKPGDTVLCRQLIKGKLMTPYHAKPYIVVKVKGSMITAARSGHEVTRNSSHFKRIASSVPTGSDPAMSDEEDDLDVHLSDPPDDDSDHQAEDINPDGPPVQPRYSMRANRRPPQRLIAEM